MAGSVKYCPVQGLFLNCDDCKTLQCMDFFLYVIEDTKTDEEVRSILITLKKLLVNQTKTTIVLDSFGSKLINAIKDDYDHIIVQNMKGNRLETALNIVLRQSRRGILVVNQTICNSDLEREINAIIKKSNQSDHLNATNPIIVRFVG